MKLSRIVVVVVSVSLSGCAGMLGVEDDGGSGAGAGGGIGGQTGGGSGGGGGTGGGVGGGGGSAAADLPCDVAAVLSDACLSCHGSAGPQVRLQSRADLAAMSAGFPTMTMGQRAVLRMRATAGAMPPAPNAPVASARVDAFDAWVTAGMIAGSCQATSDAGVPDAGPILPHDGGIAGLPCDVSAFVGSKCASCHGSPLAGGATIPLLSQADFLANAPGFPGVTVGARSEIRVHASTSPMPPAGSAAPTVAELTAFDGWIAAGMPTGTCGTIDPPDAGPAPTTCASGSYWTNGNQESSNMNPGKPCLACHSNQAPDKAYPFAGTVFLARHEKDTCNSHPPSATKVEIINSNGTIAMTLSVSTTSGNFNSARYPTVSLPYTARVYNGTRSATMTTPQTSGDCNSCHTEQGLNGALGRIVLP